MSAKSQLKILSAGAVGALLLLSHGTAVMAEKTSPTTQTLRRGLTPTAPADFGSGNAEDLAPLNPDPVLLDLPKDESDVIIDLSQPLSLDEALIKKIKTQIRQNATPRHVPAKVLQVDDIPRTKSGKIVELAVREVVHGRPVKNKEALANPEALVLFENRSELAQD